MTKRQKREQSIREHQDKVKYETLILFVESEGLYDTNPKSKGSHKYYTHQLLEKHDLIVPIIRPSGGKKYVKQIYVIKCIEAVDLVREEKAQE